ncbi:ABC transporter permease [Pseudidiomarina sediminum]|uniref:ABC transporter permease n=1 Tax=Pseudidiomarina sediminum TaxID=431675 RepID=UPI001C96E527|nr:FtsX-like permease family protein [Pseudidiomarina sediminum]MBY6064120.1 FtsX-like permease family protein [Pseudidiomarina sediminum]
MIKQRFGFELLCEWNRWAGQRGKVLLLLLGFSIVSCLFALVLRVGDALFFANPSWVGNQAQFYTVSAAYDDRRQAGVSRQTIESLEALPFVQAASWLRVINVDFRSASYPLYQPQALVFDDDLPHLLALDFPASESLQTGVWLTDRYWRETFQHDRRVVGSTLSFDRIPEGVPIRGILPPKFDRIGPWQPDIWLPEAYLNYMTPFAAQSEMMVDRFLRAEPAYYGFFSTERPLDIAAFTDELRASDFSVQGVQMQGHGGEIKVYQGIILDDQARALLERLWQFSLLLVLGLAALFALTAFMSFSNRTLLLSEEYRLLQTLGARSWDLLRPVVMAALVQIVVISLVSLLLTLVTYQLLTQRFDDSVLAPVLSGSFGLNYWWVSMLVVSCIYLLASLFPLLSLRKRQLFSRVMGTHRSTAQLLFGQVSLVFQLGLAMVTVVFATQLLKQQQAMFQPLGFDAAVTQVNVRSHGGRLPIETIETFGMNDTGRAHLAVSLSPFDAPYTIEVGTQEVGFATQFEIHNVSRNYFEVLLSDSDVHAEDWQSGIVMNRTAANFFENNGYAIQPGTLIDLGPITGTHAVHAVLDDVRHRGRFSAALPALYLPIASKGSGANYSLYMALPEMLTRLPQYLDQHLLDASMSTPLSLGELAAQHERKAQQLFYFSLLVVGVMLAGIVLTLNYQVRARLQLERSDYGVLLAIGAPVSALLAKAFRPIAMALVIAVALIALGYLLAGAELALPAISGLSIVAVVCVGVIALGATYFPVARLTRADVVTLLKQD